MKKILLVLGNHDADSYTGALADRYQAAAEDMGHEVCRLNIGEMRFDPILYRGYKEIQPLEPDLVTFQEKVRWADHMVVLYPNWWSTMPAKLKGLFDRAWLPGFAFNFNQETGRCERHLRGKTARVIVVSGTYSPLKTWWLFGDYTNEMQHGILGFAGMRAAVTTFGPADKVTDEQKGKWAREVENLGKRGI